MEEESSDEETDKENATMSIKELSIRLALWFMMSRTSFVNRKSLLQLLREADPQSLFAQLMKDPRSLFGKSNFGEVPKPRAMGLGEYVYIGKVNYHNRPS